MNYNQACELLGVNINHSEIEIKKAFRNLARKHHPDKGGDSDKFREAKDAYDFLMKTETNLQGQSNFSSEDSNQWSEAFKNMGAEWERIYEQLTATKKDYVDGIEQILKDAKLDIEQNMPIISAFDEDRLERLGYTLIKLQEQNCLTENTLNIILEHINFPQQSEFDMFNPYAGKILIDHYISKNGLIAPADVFIEDSEDILKAFQVLSGDDYEGSQCWPKPSNNLMNQENLNLLFAHPKIASSIAGALTCLDSVGLLSIENKTFLSAAAEKASTTFQSLAYSFSGKNKAECEKILENEHHKLDLQMKSQRNWKGNKMDQQASTSDITRSFKDKLSFYKKEIEDYSKELAEFTEKKAAWISNRPEQFEQLTNLLNEGVLTGGNLSEFDIYTIFVLTDKKYLDNARIAFNEGLMTPESLNGMFKTLEASGTRYNLDHAAALLSDKGLDAMRKGLISPEEAGYFSHSNDLYGSIDDKLKQYDSHNPTK